MMKKALSSSALLLMASAAGATQNDAKLSWQDGWGWGGVTFSAPRVVYLEPLPKDKSGAARGMGGALETGNAGRPLRLRMVTQDGADRLFVETFGADDKTGVLLKKSAAGPLAGNATGVTKNVPLWISSNSVRLPVERPIALWRGGASGEVFAAWRGFLKGQLKVGGKWRTACVADGDGNGLYGDAGSDQLWIDLNGDNQLDVATEQFPVAPLLRIDGRVYSLFVSPSGAATWREVEGGIGKAQLTFAPKTGEVRDLAATLVAQTGEPIAARAVDQDVELPTGRYQLLSVSMKLSDTTSREWTYSFARYFGGKLNYPFTVSKTDTARIRPMNGLKFVLKSADTAKPGANLRIEFDAASDTGLTLTNTATGENSYNRENYAKIELRDPQGKVVGNAGSGFA